MSKIVLAEDTPTITDKVDLENKIVKAAIDWERKYHEHVPNYGVKDMQHQEKELVKAVRNYLEYIINDALPTTKDEVENVNQY